MTDGKSAPYGVPSSENGSADFPGIRPFVLSEKTVRFESSVLHRGHSVSAPSLMICVEVRLMLSGLSSPSNTSFFL